MGEMVDINDELVRTVITVDDGCDHTQRFIWMMNTRRNIRNKVFRHEPKPVRVTKIRIEASVQLRGNCHDKSNFCRKSCSDCL